MGKFAVKQHNDKYAVWDPMRDSLVLVDATRQEVIDYFIEMAKERAEEDIVKQLDQLDAGKTKQDPSFKQCLRDHLRVRYCEDKEFNKYVADLLKEIRSTRFTKQEVLEAAKKLAPASDNQPPSEPHVVGDRGFQPTPNTEEKST